MLNRLAISIFLDSKCSSSHSIKTCFEFLGISIDEWGQYSGISEFPRKRTSNFCLHDRSASRVTFTMANKIILLPGLEPCFCSLVCSLIVFAQAKVFLHFADSLFLSFIALGPLSIAASGLSACVGRHIIETNLTASKMVLLLIYITTVLCAQINKATLPEKHNTFSKNRHLTMRCCIIPAYSFACYVCGPAREDQAYSADQCEKDQKRKECFGFSEYYNTCFRYHIETTDGIVQELRGCVGKIFCNNMKKICSDDEKMKEANITNCQAACCVGPGDTPCNSVIKASSSLIIMGSNQPFLLVAVCLLFFFLE